MMRSRSRLLGSCLFACFVLRAFALSAQTVSNPSKTSDDLAAEARKYEFSGDKLKAAQTYEKIVGADPAKSTLLATRLARIYAELGQTNNALLWANEVIKTNPDPQAYLAGIYSLLGDQDEAVKILANEIDAAKDGRRKIVLLWQLAEAHEKKGDRERAFKALSDAIETAKDSRDEVAARARLEKFQARKTADAKSARGRSE